MANILDILDSFEIEIDASALAPTVTVDDVFYLQDLKQRRLTLSGEITNEIVEPVIRHILQYNSADKAMDISKRRPIRLLINSFGGDLYSALSLINVIEISKTPVYAYAMGEASSAGLYILLSAHKRFALKDTTAVLHKGSATLGGTASQIENSANWYRQQLGRLKEYVLEKTMVDAKLYKKKQDEDWHLSMDEMIKFHFVDGIIDDIDLLIGD